MITVKAALDITKTMLCSVIEYGNIVLSSCIDADLHDLKVLQNNAIQSCYGISDPRDAHVVDKKEKANFDMLMV